MKHVALVPAFNEEKNIREVIVHLKKHPHLDIIVVDDGSQDKTAEIAKSMGAVVLKHNTNKGKGEALRTGFDYILKNHPQANYIVIIDADMQYDPRESPRLLSILENGQADVATGMRRSQDVPYANRMGNFVWRIVFNILFGTRLRDTNCGYMALNRKSLGKIKNIHGGYIIENSILADCVRNKLKIKQVPVSVKYGKRKIRKFARMFFGVLIFIIVEGLKHRIKG